METPLAYAFHPSSQSPEDELYPLLDEDASDTPDSELFMGVYPTSIADLDFAATVQALPMLQHDAQNVPQLKPLDESLLHQPLNLPKPQESALLSPLSSISDHKPRNGFFSPGTPSPLRKGRSGQRQRQRQRQRVASAPSSTHSDSPTCSPPGSVTGSDGGGTLSLKDSEEILNAPVKSLTEEEKKLRRRAQVAKSARKHRNRQKEELARLREQVQMLQEQMAIMTHHQGSSSPTSIKREQDVITQHRKRKKVDDLEDGEIEAVGGVLTNPSPGFVTMAPLPPLQLLHIQHWYHRLPVDTLERSKMLCRIADKRMAIGEQYIRSEFGAGVSYPMTDIKLNSNGPDLEIKQVRGRLVSGFTHHELGEACWSSFSNFQFDVPERFKRHVTCERLMELDANTRYGRTIVPVLRDRKGVVVYFHSYFLVRRHVRDDFVLITWETITDDDLYPSRSDENPETTLRNDEVGCMIIEPEQLPNKGVRSIFRSITHSTPPVGVMTHPRGKVNESFLTVFCRNADIVENSAWNLLVKTYPDRASTATVVV
ncbi:hypothetical protein BBJ29_005499 [Phytophthora kernoviae]|uniref:BZIP domain-containing protein n=1 Tax=Phytophthora kernoviae TaxID=325452 RepID=A0A3F2RRA2_9STRA|nr:hypothetical protein BBJ29_005499 [Phytophthora kernoviae]RLN62676.1 hypothetical protein BBP00_00004617 [Phytophthora kernoviae]